ASAIVPTERAQHDGTAAFSHRMELISPTDFAIDFARDRVQAVQDYALLAARSIANLFRRPLYVADMIRQADLIGVGSLPFVVLTGFFIGGALALNSANTLHRFGSLALIGHVVAVVMVTVLARIITE